MLYPSEQGMMQEFVNGLALLLRLVSEHIIVIRPFVSQIVTYARAISENVLGYIEMAARGNAINIVLLVFSLRAWFFLGEIKHWVEERPRYELVISLN